MIDESLDIAETFYSIKGEGIYQGVPMYFVRLASCNVGIAQEGNTHKTRTGSLARVCTSWNGSKLFCDTDYRKRTTMTVNEIVQDYRNKGHKAQRYVLTGGEPLMASNTLGILALNTAFGALGLKMHIETNGTCPVPPFIYKPYIACSPKAKWRHDVVANCDELRLAISTDMVGLTFPPIFLNHPCVLLSPVNEADSFNEDNLQRCLQLLKEHPTWRLNLQLHKYIKVP